LKEVCGAANIKTTRPDCSVPERMELPVVQGTLLRSVRFWQVRCALFISSRTLVNSLLLRTIEEIRRLLCWDSRRPYPEQATNARSVLRRTANKPGLNTSGTVDAHGASPQSVTDSASLLQRLWEFLRPPGSTKAGFELGAGGLTGSWVKRTSEDLSSVISNFADWDEVFSLSECGRYRAMLNDKDGSVFRHSPQHIATNDLCWQRLMPQG
jgi:hypothetical protein